MKNKLLNLISEELASAWKEFKELILYNPQESSCCSYGSVLPTNLLRPEPLRVNDKFNKRNPKI